MALQSIVPIWLQCPHPGSSVIPNETQVVIIDAAGESGAYIGYAKLSTGPGTSKTLQSGDTIHWKSSNTTFANAGTTCRVGVQDVSGGLEDGSYDVNADLTGGGGGIVNGVNSTVMTTGSKVIDDGDLIAVVIEATARAGADTWRPQGLSNGSLGNFPYVTADTGGGPAKIVSATPLVTIEFADGTICTLGGNEYAVAAYENVAFNNSANPDEVASLFEVPFGMQIDMFSFGLGEVDSGETGNAKFYTDPTGTPTAVDTIAVDPDLCSATGSQTGRTLVQLTTPLTLTTGTLYGISYEATAAGGRNWNRVTLPSAATRVIYPFGTTLQGGSRQNATGAFGSLSSTQFLSFGIRIVAIDFPSGGGGGASQLVNSGALVG